jgi:hypothetical protein
MDINPVQEDRSKIELKDPAVLRHWMKALGATQEELASAIAKVGACPDTVRKELARCAEKNKPAK